MVDLIPLNAICGLTFYLEMSKFMSIDDIFPPQKKIGKKSVKNYYYKTYTFLDQTLKVS